MCICICVYVYIHIYVYIYSLWFEVTRWFQNYQKVILGKLILFLIYDFPCCSYCLGYLLCFLHNSSTYSILITFSLMLVYLHVLPQRSPEDFEEICSGTKKNVVWSLKKKVWDPLLPTPHPPKKTLLWVSWCSLHCYLCLKLSVPERGSIFC